MTLRQARGKLLTIKIRNMQNTEVLNVSLKACRPRFKAGSELSGKVNRVIIDIDQTLNDGTECLDVGLKWETKADQLGCDPE